MEPTNNSREIGKVYLTMYMQSTEATVNTAVVIHAVLKIF